MANQRLAATIDLLARSGIRGLSAVPDEQLVQHFARVRDESAFAELVRRHGSMVLGVCRRILTAGPDAEDAFQATFLFLALRVGEIRNTASVASWLHGVARRVALNARKSRSRRTKHEQFAASDRPTEFTTEPATAASLTELQGALDEELARVPEPFRGAFVLCCLEGRTRPEAAVELSCTEGTVSSRLARARQMLQDRLTRRGIAPAVALTAGALFEIAVPPTLSASTARIAGLLTTAGQGADTIPPAVAALIEGVTTMTVKKTTVLAGLVVVAALAAGGIGLSAGSFQNRGPGAPPERPTLSKGESPGDNQKKATSPSEYALKEGAVLKLVRAPFPEERDRLYMKFEAAKAFQPPPPSETRLMAVYTNGGTPVSANAFTDRSSPGTTENGKPLAAFLEYPLNVDMANVLDRDHLLESVILDADVVLQKNAALDKLIPALRDELKTKCGIDLRLEFAEVETEVVRITGKHTLVSPAANPSRLHDDAAVVHFYAKAREEHSNGIHTDTKQLPSQLAQFLGLPVIDESNLKSAAVWVTIRHHLRYPITAKTRAEDADPVQVLKNVADQTGLTLKLEKQKVRVLVVEKQKKPADPPKKLGRVPDPEPNLQAELARWDTAFRHGSDEKFAELERTAGEWLKKYPGQDDRGHIYFQVAHVAAQSRIDTQIARVREYGQKVLEQSRDPVARGTVYSYLASAAEVDRTLKTFEERRRLAADVLLTGFAEALAQELPAEAPELPAVNRIGGELENDPVEAARIRTQQAVQMEARREAKFVRDLVQRRNTLVLQLRGLYRPTPNVHGRNEEGPKELRKLAAAKLSASATEALLAEVMKPPAR
ncbi:sigma-70 family rna polymerase sigma factor : RNA polymerase sigma factor, sigma-70 family OS=Singulisphaera acidiphila (strain ATCC BAA-1392 / DSM 18658 / VKM B-2454 / MOB10) GN=Sinac_4264 PE=4 SV=1: Sigma70_r2: Sigma70_r4_2: DUF3738 [Gemmata massiliana]|uniref:ECF RNA polymerase sigma factor SigE n=1 Tax=Gemmata massiliana TaxID=1210884 RepID=A0A6P2DLR3_9BACT|nr:sigma-70 family RNA polymerase sigma factor [Gemmata massiliana]VTS02712.1 sigma-70 family rna polymerase sigma factor : RNA polymerase sigma factor, sigma-70 family OS=Singulisphaera acidiphila (strain ATCC BAA-1392 / DSM 18658 / VKM B-2454 / MOB10) GN=Sinac_4264 PE=4 SV=1: Sigma70_r2: Sigma70_r4_2: DUF3738 [Gemmata massiliana]